MSVVTAVISAVAFAMAFGSLAFVSFFILRLASRPNGIEQLFSQQTTYGRRWGTLYDVLHETRVFWIVPELLAALTRSAIVGLVHSGVVQLGVLIALELGMCLGERLLCQDPFIADNNVFIHSGVQI